MFETDCTQDSQMLYFNDIILKSHWDFCSSDQVKDPGKFYGSDFAFPSKQVDKMGKRFRKGEKDGREGGGGGGGGGRLNEEELKALADKTSFSLANVKDFHEVQFYK